uniref:Uncharacterized protein n=1 Tax=Aegilops tauschii subsp. strangulata TaxID=200361 RepID=A0A453AP25_AEGTS
AGKVATSSVGWGFMWVIFFGLGFAGVGAYAVYKYRLRVKCSNMIAATLFYKRLCTDLCEAHVHFCCCRQCHGRATWIQRSARSWRSTCRWRTRRRRATNGMWTTPTSETAKSFTYGSSSIRAAVVSLLASVVRGIVRAVGFRAGVLNSEDWLVSL